MQSAVFQRVCIGLLVPPLYLPTVVGWNHPIHFDVITYLNGYDHCEPAGTQPRVRLLSERDKNNKTNVNYCLKR